MFKGHTLNPVPNIPDLNYLKVITENDMLVITGGDDDSVRTHNEIALIMRAMINNTPIIGICHGALLLTQFFSGTVVDVKDHHNTTHSITYTTFNTEHTVNSFHKSAIFQEPKDSQVLAIDSKGNIECWIKGNIAAVMWHPERQTNYRETFLPTEVLELYDESSLQSLSQSAGSLDV